MKSIVDIYAEELKENPQTAKIENLFDKGYITYAEAIKMILESAEKNKFYYVIQYKGYIAKKYHDYCEPLYTWEEAKKELQRLKEVAPDFAWRTRKEPRTEESVILYAKCRQRTTNRP